MKLHKTLLITLVLASACRPASGDFALMADDSYKGKIRVSMANPVAGTASDYKIVMSAGPEVVEMGVCDTPNALDCKKTSNHFYNTRRIQTTTTRSFFVAEDDAFIEDGLFLILVAMDKTGTPVDARKVRFVKHEPSAPSAPASPTPPAGPTPNANDSKGTGGVKGFKENTYASLRYQINAPADNSDTKSHGLLVFLHGSGASNYAEWMKASETVASQFGLIPVSVRAPNGSGWNEGDQDGNAKLLDDLIQNELLKKYNVDKRKIFFQGQSSGSGFLGTHFIPLHGKNYRGGALLLCGAGVPKSAFTPTEEQKKTFSIYFEITAQDGIWEQQFAQATKFYKDAGFVVKADNTKPGGHCAFNQQDIDAKQLPEMIKLVAP